MTNDTWCIQHSWSAEGEKIYLEPPLDHPGRDELPELVRLLGDQNFMLTYREGRLSRLTLLGGSLDAPVTKVVKNQDGNATPEVSLSFAQMAQSRVIERVPGSFCDPRG